MAPSSNLSVMLVVDLLQRLLALFLLLLLSPLLLVIAILVRLNLGGPVLFFQKRPGLNGQPFLLVKFRTMSQQCDANGVALPDSQRLGSFGQWLRRSSLDELPELINILKGDMVFVGPRPLLMDYLPLYSKIQARRHLVKPGLTGWAQVHGRNSLSWDEKFRLDVWYVDHRSLALDLRIIQLTMTTLIRGDGITATGQATTTPFNGS